LGEIADVDRLHNQHVRFLAQINGDNHQRNAITPQVAQPQTDSPKVKAELNNLKERINLLRSNMAANLTNLDIAFDKWRLFNCDHDKYRDIPDGHNSTHEVSINAIANHFFEDWMKDDKFIKEYNDARRDILNHHKAHERAQQGKGVASWRIRKEFEALDQKRGVATKY
jgi:hypothetical protein